MIEIFFISKFKLREYKKYFKLEYVLEICWSETKIRLLNLKHEFDIGGLKPILVRLSFSSIELVKHEKIKIGK